MNILIVDDDIIIRNWIKILINEISNQAYNLFFAENGLEALEFVEKNDINIVITDIKMPKMDGLELIKILSNDYPDIYTCVLSSYDDFEYVRLMLKNGALDYILKAELSINDFKELFDKINKIHKDKNTQVLIKEESNKCDCLESVLTGDVSQNAFYSANIWLNQTFNLAILRLHMHTENSIADFINLIISHQNIKGKCYRLNQETYAIMYQNSNKLTNSVVEYYQNLLTIIEKSLINQHNIVLKNSLNFECNQSLDLKLELEKAISAISGKKCNYSPSVEKAIELLNNNYMKKVTLDDVSKYVFLNKSYLCQIFKKDVGISFNEYLLNLRVQKSKSLLLNTTMSISDIAEHCGFANQNYFSKVFKQTTAFSPAEFRKSTNL